MIMMSQKRRLQIHSCFRFCVAIRKPELHVRKASHCGSKQQWVRMPWSLYYCLFAPHVVLFFAHIPFVENHTSNATSTERLQQKLFVTWFLRYVAHT